MPRFDFFFNWKCDWSFIANFLVVCYISDFLLISSNSQFWLDSTPNPNGLLNQNLCHYLYQGRGLDIAVLSAVRMDTINCQQFRMFCTVLFPETPLKILFVIEK